MNEWHCMANGVRYGPIELAALRQWMVEGRVKPADLVWTEGMAEWRAASTVSELAGAAQGELAAVPPPLHPYYPGAPTTSAPGAVASLVCGILAVVLYWACGAGVVLGAVAIHYRKKARDLIAMNPGRLGGGGMSVAGLVLGIIGIVFSVFCLIYFIAIAGFVFSSHSMHPF